MCAALMCGAAAVEAAPVTLTYEGDLVASGGAPAQGEHKIEFSLYASSAGGAALWTEVHPDVLVVDGHFFVDLGRQTPLEDLTGDDALFLGVAIDDDAEAEPRMTVGGALRSQWAALAANAQDVREADIQPRSVALAGTPTRLENGSLRLGAEANQVLTAASLATLTGGGNADALHTHAGQVGGPPAPGKFLGLTVATYNGDMGGRFGVTAKCAAEFQGSHQCSYCEILDDRLTQPLAGMAWITATDLCNPVDPSDHSCANVVDGRYMQEYTSSDALKVGNAITPDGTNDRARCGTSHPIACCAN
jgi:hypothetical protein